MDSRICENDLCTVYLFVHKPNSMRDAVESYEDVGRKINVIAQWILFITSINQSYASEQPIFQNYIQRALKIDHLQVPFAKDHLESFLYWCDHRRSILHPEP